MCLQLVRTALVSIICSYAWYDAPHVILYSICVLMWVTTDCLSLDALVSVATWHIDNNNSRADREASCCNSQLFVSILVYVLCFHGYRAELKAITGYESYKCLYLSSTPLLVNQ